MRWIISGVALLLILIFGLLTRVWAGFLYFSLSTCLLFSLYWLVLLLIDYHSRFKKLDEKGFNLYIASLINSTNTTLEMVEMSRNYYIKKFKRSQWREKLIEIVKIMFALGIAVGCVLGIILQAK